MAISDDKIEVRIGSELKERAVKAAREKGLTLSDAIRGLVRLWVDYDALDPTASSRLDLPTTQPRFRTCKLEKPKRPVKSTFFAHLSHLDKGAKAWLRRFNVLVALFHSRWRYCRALSASTADRSMAGRVTDQPPSQMHAHWLC